MVVVEHVYAAVLGVALSRAPPVARAEVAVRDVGRQGPGAHGFRNALSLPGPLVTMGRDDDPFPTQRMPTLFPDHTYLRLTTRQSEPSIAGMMRSGKDAYQPRPEHHFTFGLWTVGNPGRDPFGDPVRPPMSPVRIVQKLAQLGAYGVNLHDNDLIPRDSSTAEADRIVREFKSALADTGMKVPMATTNLFSDPLFRDGAFTSNDSKVRAYALQKTMRAIDLGVDLGATTYVFWGGREGSETNAGKNVQEAIKWFRDAMNFLCEYVKSQGYSLKLAL